MFAPRAPADSKILLKSISITEIRVVFCSLLLLLSSVLSQIWELFGLYAILTAIGSFLSPVLGATLWFLPAPFEAVTVTKADFSPYLAITPAFLGGVFLHAIRHPRYRFQLLPFTFSLGFITAGLLSVMLSNNISGIRNLISIGLLAMCTVAGISAVSNEPRKAYLILAGAILSATGAAIFAILQWEGGWRLSLTQDWGGGVRHLDTSVSIAIAICISLLLYGKKFLNDVTSARPPKFQNYRKTLQVIVLFLLLVLLATVSRGAIAALVFGLILIGLSYGTLALLSGRLPKHISIIVFSFLIVVFFAPVLDQLISRGHIISRTMLMLQEPGENARWLIWSNAIGSLQGWEWVFGAGLGSFRELADAGPHSLYISALVEIGVIGFMFVFLLSIVAGISGQKKAGLPFLMFFSFFLFSFLTKGSLYNKYFYFSFVIASALAVTAPSKKSRQIEKSITHR